jgi:hypothetical protein
MRTQWGNAKPLGYQQISTAAATGLTVPKGSAPGEAPQAAGVGSATSGAVFAVIAPEIGDVRWRDDGVDPTTSVGMLLSAGTILIYTGKLQAIKFINAVAASGAKVNVSYYAS